MANYNQNPNNPNNIPPYNPNQPVRDGSGMGVILGVLLAVVVAIGAYFFMQSRDGNTALEPAAGMEAPVANDATIPNAEPTDPNANPPPTLAR